MIEGRQFRYYGFACAHRFKLLGDVPSDVDLRREGLASDYATFSG